MSQSIQIQSRRSRSLRLAASALVLAALASSALAAPVGRADIFPSSKSVRTEQADRSAGRLPIPGDSAKDPMPGDDAKIPTAGPFAATPFPGDAGGRKPPPTKPKSFTASCEAVKRLGYPITTTTVTHSGAVAPRAGSWGFGPGQTYGHGQMRNYGVAGIDMILQDSFPLNPTIKERQVCQVDVVVHGVTPAHVQNNDGLGVFAPKAQGLVIQNGTWATSRGSVLLPGKSLTDGLGPWVYNLTVNGTDPSMATALFADENSGLNALDLFVQDDTMVASASMTYHLY